MRVTFALPCYAANPLGGLKVVYEYANRLVARGHDVVIIHPRALTEPPSGIDNAKSYLWGFKTRLRDRPLVPWFEISPSVKIRFVRTLSDDAFPEADVVFATGWQTAEYVWCLPANRGRKLYLVYDVEFWETEPPDVRAEIEGTFRLGMPIIAGAPAAEEMVRAAGVKPRATIVAGIDHELLRVVTAIENRNPSAIGFPMRQETHKGSCDAITAVELVRERLGNGVRAAAFGTDLPESMPTWIERWESPSDGELRRFYNSLAVFVFPSRHEAWGLPGLEAQACGAALVAADNRGVRGYAKDRETALLVPPSRPELLADAVERLVRNDELRRRLAMRGVEVARQFEWSEAVKRVEAVLESE